MESYPASRRRGGRKRWWPMSLASLLLIGSEPPPPPAAEPPPLSLFDARLGPLRVASARWERRQGPDRRVIDQVCLVPDLATYFEEVTRWDRGHFYPILIEEAESTLRFLRAFRPARLVRVPATTRPIGPGQAWAAAASSVEASWREVGAAVHPTGGALGTARPPESLGPTPPGLVLAGTTAPMLAGAVALAAGHFQPLARLDASKGYAQTLSPAEFAEFDRDVTATVARVLPDHGGLGDDCDFLTMAGDYPYRYRDAQGEDEAVDDGLARGPGGVRWAYAGRLLGDPATSVYRAMCSLFLPLDSATLINGYDEATSPWAEYATRGGALRLAARMTTRHHSGRQDGTVNGWYEAFDPDSRSSLVWINSHGSPTVFHLQEAEASAVEVPRTVPCAVVMVHSFSAADPTDPATIAGRWLANGAFLYFGSVNEPFLQAFRTPNLAVDLLAEHLPLAAVLRNTTSELFGGPWRLEYLGDPLFRLKPRPLGVLLDPPGSPPDQRPVAVLPGRLPAEGPPPRGVILAGPPAGAAPTSLGAAVDAALVLACATEVAPADPMAVAGVISQLGAMDRDALCPEEKRLLDLVLADLLFVARRRGELRSRIESIPPAERSPALGRWLDAVRAGEFAWLLAGGEFSRAVAAWGRLLQADDVAADYRRALTARIGAMADDPDRRSEWADALRAAIDRPPPGARSADLKAELGRVRAAIARDGSPAPPGNKP